MNERETMVGILKRPVRTQMRDNRLASNRFAALMEDKKMDHGGYPSMVQKFAANRYVTISNKNEAEKRPSIIRRIEDAGSIGPTECADTVKRNNCSQIMPTMKRMMTRGDAWNEIKGRNWVQQTIADRDKKWCPTDLEKKLSPTDRIGAVDKAYFGKLLDNRNELTTACTDSGCMATIPYASQGRH